MHALRVIKAPDGHSPSLFSHRRPGIYEQNFLLEVPNTCNRTELYLAKTSESFSIQQLAKTRGGNVPANEHQA